MIKVNKNEVSVELEWIGEGWVGDYQEDDPEDTPLLRFTVYFKGEEVDDASYCTQISANTDEATQLKVADYILSEVYEPLISGHRIKKICEKLSWVTEKDIN